MCIRVKKSFVCELIFVCNFFIKAKSLAIRGDVH